MKTEETTSEPSAVLHCAVDVSFSHADRLLLEQLAEEVAEVHPVPRPAHIILADDALLHRLNADYRGTDSATDVLSFDLSASDQDVSPAGGEVYISMDRAQRQACEQQVTCLQEVARLLTHGLLHLAGFRHDSGVELDAMEAETDRLLRRCGLMGPGASP